MVIVTVHTRAEAAAVVQRALLYVGDVSVQNVSGTEDAWEVSFDSSVVMNDDELVEVRGNNSWRAA